MEKYRIGIPINGSEVEVPLSRKLAGNMNGCFVKNTQIDEYLLNNIDWGEIKSHHDYQGHICNEQYRTENGGYAAKIVPCGVYWTEVTGSDLRDCQRKSVENFRHADIGNFVTENDRISKADEMDEEINCDFEFGTSFYWTEL